MPPLIANPIVNAPFEAPSRHFAFDEEGITDRVVDGRRESGYFLPIASPRKKGGQLRFETEWTQDRFLSSPRINRIRERVNQWRAGGYLGCTRTTDSLLQYWSAPTREKKLFFCQREALETAIYLTEVAAGFGDAWIENELRKENEDFGGGLPRLAMKMATVEFASDAADRIYQAIVRAQDGEARIKPILRPHKGEEVGTTRYVSFDTTKPTYATRPDKSHVSHVVADTGSWEQKMAQVLEEMDEVECYVKNQGLNFTIPYMLNGDQRQYFPDFVARVRSAGAPADRLNLIIEVSGEGRRDKAAKVAATRTLWVPAINNHGGFGRWVFVEVTDPWDAKGTIRSTLAAVESTVGAP